MFQPQPTPFAASCFSSLSYGIGPAHDIGFLFPTGGGGAGPAGTASAGASGALCPPYSSQPTTPSSLTASHAQQVEQSPRPQHQQHQHRRHNHGPTGSSHVRMEESDRNPHDLAAQQAAAEDYRPVHEGLFVGDKTTTEVITHEYAKADPVYVEKTIALPQTYSHYRPIKGDGNCGWRAIGFAYFEKLLDVGDQGQIEGEVARLMSLNHMLTSVGRYDYVSFEDFAEEVISLLRDLAANVGNPGLARVILHQRWNDASVEGSIIYYFRLLAATYLKANADAYDPFVPDGLGIMAYCSQTIEIPNREIEQLGIVGLSNLLLKPINFVLEIAYLDRSAGSQVNRYRFPEEANAQDPADLGPTIYLLYRPDHYDILYRAPPVPLPISVPVPVAPVNLQINRVTGYSSNISITSSLGGYASTDLSPLAMIPGFSTTLGSMPPLGAAPSVSRPVGEAFSPAQHHGTWVSSFPDNLSSQAAQPPPQQPPPVIQGMTSNPPLTPSPPTVGSSSLPGGHAAVPGGVGAGSMLAPTPGYQIRFSAVQLDYAESKNAFPEPTFHVTTNTFKNSVWNRAHYGNPDFHPEEYVPGADHIDGRVGAKEKARKGC